MSRLYIDSSRRFALLISQDAKGADYIQHTGKKTELLHVDTAKFAREFKPAPENSTTLSDPQIAQSMLDGARLGVAVTPAARFALQRIINQPTEGAPMASTEKPTPKTKKKSEALPFASAKVMSGPTVGKDEPKKPAPPTPPAHQVVEKAKIEEEITPKPSETPSDENQSQVAVKLGAMAEAAKIVQDATDAAAKMLADAHKMLDEARQKAEEKKALDAAKAEADKVLTKAKAEVEKIKKEIVALSGKKTKRMPQGEGKKSTNRIDISGKRIKLLKTPRMKAGSDRAEKIQAVIECNNTNDALKFASASFILSLVKKAVIEVY